MAVLHSSELTLRFFGDTLDPEEITLSLGAAPTVGVKKGGVWITSGGVEKVSKTGSWRLSMPRYSPGELDQQVGDLFKLLSADMAIWADFATRFDGDIFVGLFLNEGNEGVEFRPETLAAIGIRGLRLDLDIYGPDSD